ASAFFGEGMKRIAYTHGNFPQTLVVPSTLEELVLTTGLLTAEQLAEAHVYVAADRDSAAWSVAKAAVEKAGLDPASHLHRYVDPALSLSSPAIDRAGDASKVQVKAGETIEVMATMTGGVAVGREARAIEVGPGGAETVVSDWNSASDSDPSLDDADGGAISSWVRFTWVPSVDGASLRVESRDITFRVVTGVLGSALPPAPEPGEGQWVQDAGGWWYRFADGTYPRGQALVIDGETYRFDQSGHALTGWVRDGGYWFHHGASGAMSTGWLVDGGAWYYLVPGWGAMAIGWVEDGGEWYYLNAAGHMTTGWQKIEGSWFYLGDSGKMATGWRHIDGYWHFFEPTGELRH
ncbi:MAG: N-acetylmuramoyl-L-alanine amidase family protein, partial [Actinomyces sp.]